MVEKIQEGIIFKRKIIQIGNSKGIIYSQQELDFLGIDLGTEVDCGAYVGKKGKFLATWKQKETKK